ncbi:MAG: transcriptional regulator [Elusimicrobia bacterium GWC2_51_8]|nr:MAG: transcriptional regulator [Elusimicrobia bacterium GWA2_51_34]OGR60362.1 MAG: transcriptional regulator [Elusimicrobia bacterium GWC2_51_8]HAF95125.1 transcriptional regulator [Elusimicrobiota bacterium]HCE97204.1 transcriptional regulator [Elusimicrobiota bacterium]
MDYLKNKLRVLRAEKDISQEALAKAIGISRQTINAIEGEDYSPSVLLALKIAKYFNKPMEEVFYIEDLKKK